MVSRRRCANILGDYVGLRVANSIVQTVRSAGASAVGTAVVDPRRLMGSAEKFLWWWPISVVLALATVAGGVVALSL